MDDEDREGAELIRQLQARRGVGCKVCGRRLRLHHVLASMALGAGQAPHCLDCLATRLEESKAALIEQLHNYSQHRACFRTAWEWATREEGVDPDSL